MGIPENHTVVSVVVPIELRDRLHETAVERNTSVSKMLAEWLESGIGEPLLRSGKRQAVRRLKPDEAFVSLPREWQRSAGIEPDSKLDVAYSPHVLVIKKS